MRASTAVLVSVAAAATLSCSDSTGPVMHLATNGGFETGDFTGWILADSGTGSFIVTSDTVLPISGTHVPHAPEKAYVAVTDQGGGGTHILYQDITIPAKARATFKATIYVVNLDTLYFNAATTGLSFDGGENNQQFRVDIMDPSASLYDIGSGVLLNVFQTKPGDPPTIGPKAISADLTPFAGQTIRIRFAEADNQYFFQAGVDAVDVTSQ